jgi:exopolysaccharide biosynthesis polyprenyl glycosylphosphotransferase
MSAKDWLHNKVTADGRSRIKIRDFLNSLAFIGDFVAIAASMIISFWLRFQSGFIPIKLVQIDESVVSVASINEYHIIIITGQFLLVAMLLNSGLYSYDKILNLRIVFGVVTKTLSIWLFLYVGGVFFLKLQPAVSRLFIIIFIVTSLCTIFMWRSLLYTYVRSSRVLDDLRLRILLVDWSPEIDRLTDKVITDPAAPYEIVGKLTSDEKPVAYNKAEKIQIVGKISELESIIQMYSVEIVIFAENGFLDKNSVSLFKICERLLVQVKFVPPRFEIMMSSLGLEEIKTVPVLGVNPLSIESYKNRILKRIIDVIGSAFGLLITFPIVLCFGVIIYFQSPGPVLYRQVRTGRKGKNFIIYKLRSMKLNAENNGAQWAVKGDSRRLPIGRFLREWNLDEVPQFWNVLRGDMSLVGPRPERPELIEKFQYTIPLYNTRLACKPGMTGWAQVNGLRGNTDLSERIRYDIFYLNNWNLIFDVQIMLSTVFKNKNAY